MRRQPRSQNEGRDRRYLALNYLVLIGAVEVLPGLYGNGRSARGIQIIGTLGVLRLAAIRGLIDLPSTLARLLNTNFRMSHALVENLILEDRERRSGPAG